MMISEKMSYWAQLLLFFKNPIYFRITPLSIYITNIVIICLYHSFSKTDPTVPVSKLPFKNRQGKFINLQILLSPLNKILLQTLGQLSSEGLINYSLDIFLYI